MDKVRKILENFSEDCRRTTSEFYPSKMIIKSVRKAFKKQFSVPNPYRTTSNSIERTGSALNGKNDGRFGSLCN